MSLLLRLAPFVLVVAGCCGLAVDSIRTVRAAATRESSGEFWRAVDRNGALLEDHGDEIRLRTGDRLEVSLDGEALKLEEIQVVFTRAISGATLDIAFENETADSGDTLLRLAPAATFGIVAMDRPPSGPPRILHSTKRATPLDALHAPVVTRIHVVGDEAILELDGKEIDRVRGLPGVTRKIAFSTISGTIGLRGLEFQAQAGSTSIERRVEFRERGIESGESAAIFAVARFLAAIAFVAFVLRSICLTSPPLGILCEAVALGMAPCGAILGAGLVDAVPRSPLVFVVAGLAGLLAGALRLRPYFVMPTDPGCGRWRRSIVSIAAIGFAVSTLHRHADAIERPLLDVERVARDRPVAPVRVEEGPLRLDASNVFGVDSMMRDGDVSARVKLDPNSILQVRLRSRQPRSPEGVSLFVSADGSFRSGFWVEGRGAFEPVGSAAAAVAPGVDHDLKVVVRERRFVATLDGKPYAEVEEAMYGEGAIQVLAARGGVEMRALRIEPRAVDADAAPSPERGRKVVTALLLVIAILTASAAGALAVGLLPALEWIALGALPIAWGIWLTGIGRTLPASVLGLSIAASLTTVLLPLMVHARRLGGLRMLWFPVHVLVTVIAVVPLRTLGDPPRHLVDDEFVSRLPVTKFPGDRIADDLLWLQHPIFRRWNLYLADHAFRGRRHPVARAPGVARVLCLGTSSTYGEEADIAYPQRIERLLAADGRQIEVMNGGVRGSIGDQLFRVLRDAWSPFAPDVVTISLFYNDSYCLGQVDNEAYLATVCAADGGRSAIGDFKFEREMSAAKDRFERDAKLFLLEPAAVELANGDDSPPARWERMLRRYVALARERGFRLVFVKEAVRGDEPRLWKAEFRAVMDRVGIECGIPVVDPTPLLLQRGGARLFVDQVHPGDEGHQAVAESIAPVVARVLDEMRR